MKKLNTYQKAYKKNILEVIEVKKKTVYIFFIRLILLQILEKSFYII